ncbi:MAG: hypothetical protein A3E37_05140 [Candidatus Andersenbacteria bacterium RIFCSPHIGHO2_12_FULL_46_9]|nr:MAG: hypothetical protein UW94_C0003G0108 [Parcubacteria group bacterium GW2011_GWA2_45_14]OGY33737.1 MAG: hypothetical protein A3B76_02655 [Candidatus Andersenbacteria bacterium RIFCSPHIGHO2_02_FULL_46_16]OGY36171.1 MAG: hypothetical protein A3I08_04970 [Candidatus Andersenbacteria bacterium RIFCSPLOWO2_02_FULL_46_11]OGY36990.1 MAG: hypothetical protein A3E37_05140 [Candidatus Andersenbacteria bacterium RIFCSPHIGHO2_12_FULL_46_9]OGY38323.1 MAG: hypothetical protein A3G57_00945 [Candidatus A
MEKWPSIKQEAGKTEHQEENGKDFGKWRIDEIISPTIKEKILTVKQIHGGNIGKAEQVVPGETEADGILITNESGIIAGISTADCAPVIILTENKAIALHVSRKTLVNGQMDNVLNYLEPKEIDYIYVGPHICEYHFSFLREEYMLRRFRLRFGRATHWHHGSIYLSLKVALQYFFNDWDIHPNKIYYDGRCTYEMLMLPSYRRRLDTGRAEEVKDFLTTVRRRGVT